MNCNCNYKFIKFSRKVLQLNFLEIYDMKYRHCSSYIELYTKDKRKKEAFH